MWSQELYLAAWNFAAEAHAGQTVPGSQRAYINHVGSVAMEVAAALAQRDDVDDPDLAIQCALLHDVVEDTPVTEDEVRARFGAAVAAGVAALSKDDALASKSEMMTDSLHRIKQQPHEVWMVKLADRITNLQEPPAHWSADKIARYHAEAELICTELEAACPILGARLRDKLARYTRYLGRGEGR